MIDKDLSSAQARVLVRLSVGEKLRKGTRGLRTEISNVLEEKGLITIGEENLASLAESGRQTALWYRPKLGPVKRMAIEEFRGKGILQEVNRQFFHPIGLALEVVVEEDGTETLGGIWDYRDDPEGVLYDETSPPDTEKALYAEILRASKREVRASSERCDENGIQKLLGPRKLCVG